MKKILPVVFLFCVLSTCSGMNGMGQMLIDGGEMLVDAGNGNAQTAPRTVTADTDSSRMEGGILPLTSTAVVVVSGPIVLTSLSGRSSVFVWITPDTAACDIATATVTFELLIGSNVNGLLLRQGQKLCGAGLGSSLSLIWAGYRPY